MPTQLLITTYKKILSMFFGYGSRRKFVQIAYQISKNSNFDIEVLQIALHYDKDTNEHWYKNG